MCEDTLGQTRQIVGPVLIWLLAAAVVGALIDVPAWSAQLSETMAVQPWLDIGYWVSEIVMWILVVTYAAMLLRTWFTKDHVPFTRLVFGGAATVLAYGINNLLLKETYGKVRPCNVFETAGECPGVENFSYPSNHTVIAFGLAMGLALAIPWLSYIAFPLAIIAGVARVLAGHHYPHDVLAGAVLGMLGVLGALLMFVTVQASVAKKLSATRDKTAIER